MSVTPLSQCLGLWQYTSPLVCRNWFKYVINKTESWKLKLKIDYAVSSVTQQYQWHCEPSLRGVNNKLGHNTAMSATLRRRCTRSYTKVNFHWLSCAIDTAELWLTGVNDIAESWWHSNVFGSLHDGYLGEFTTVWENNLGCDSVAQGEMFDEKKTEFENLVRLSL